MLQALNLIMSTAFETPARADVATTPCQAIVLAYFEGTKCQDLAGKLANRWAYFADAFPVNSSVALEVGLLHQEALDGKLNAEAQWNFYFCFPPRKTR